MLKRSLIFENPYHISVRNSQLVVRNKDDNSERTVPIEDIGYIIFEHPHITFTQSVMDHMAQRNVGVVFCDQKYMPVSMLFHLDSNTTQTEKFRAQVNSSEPFKKQLWQQTIKAKILNQAKMLQIVDKESQSLEYLSRQVRSGDPDNIEGRAARIYWSSLFGNKFTRDRQGVFPNNLLNYGYIVLRAATARALCGSGLLPTLGIHHRNRYNSYCLADDIMEPYRPFVDMIVWRLSQLECDQDDISRHQKAELIQVTSMDTLIGGKKRPLMIALTESTATLAKCFLGDEKKMKYPELIDHEL